MSIASEITRLQSAKSDLATSIGNKGVTVPASATLDDYPALVDSIQTSGGSLPYDAEIEYIETDRSAVICTNVYPTTLNLTIEYTSMNSMLFGWSYNDQANNTWICCIGSIIYYKNYNSSYSFSGYNDETWHTYKYDMQNGFYKDNVLLKSFTASLGNSQISSIPLYIGNCYDRKNGTFKTGAGTYTKIKMCKIYSGSTLIRDYIPVRVGTVGYLYDRVNGKLVSGEGPGSFTLGPDVV